MSLKCDNPKCAWRYQFPPSSFESHLLEKVVDVSKNTCCQAPTVRYFCPTAEEARKRLDTVRKQIKSLKLSQAVIEKRLEAIEKYHQTSTVSCYEKYKEHRKKMQELANLRYLRKLYAKTHRITCESDYPEDMRMLTDDDVSDVSYEDYDEYDD